LYRYSEAFSAGDFPKAMKQFTMAIRMDKTNHVLFSNRSVGLYTLNPLGLVSNLQTEM
jgi:hypothetical protein